MTRDGNGRKWRISLLTRTNDPEHNEYAITAAITSDLGDSLNMIAD